MKQTIISKIVYQKFKAERLTFKASENRIFKLNNLNLTNMLKKKELIVNKIN